MKFDIRAPKRSRVPERIRTLAEGRPIFVAGSTVEGNPAEEELVIRAWKKSLARREECAAGVGAAASGAVCGGGGDAALDALCEGE